MTSLFIFPFHCLLITYYGGWEGGIIHKWRQNLFSDVVEVLVFLLFQLILYHYFLDIITVPLVLVLFLFILQ